MAKWYFTPDADSRLCRECGDPAFVIWKRAGSESGLYCSECACALGFILSTKQVAALRGISTTTVRKLCREQKFEARQDWTKTVGPWFILADHKGRPRLTALAFQ
jgi:hypothetical protein